jgi:hypothetical protein
MYIANCCQSKRGKMLLSKIEKERLAEASISLAEIKATKKIILEELSVPNEDIRKKLK